jgi:peptide chain release factor 3
VQAGDLHDPRIRALLGEAPLAQLAEELELLEHVAAPLDRDAVLTGETSPVFFGSALTNFGVSSFLHEFLDLAPPPMPRESSVGPIGPEHPAFTGFVFKIQANMDPKHRDRIAFVRVCSGRFEAGMTVNHVRLGKAIRLAAPQTFLARERSAVEEAWPGDVIGVVDKGMLRIGDTLSGNGALEFVGIPRFAPEHFARVVLADPMRRKQLDTGLRQLTEEGAAQVFYAESATGAAPILGAVGLLQFDVMLHRLEHEYGVPARLERLGYSLPHWVDGPAKEIDRIARGHGRMKVYDTAGRPMILFADKWTLRSTLEHEKDVVFRSEAP